MSRPASASLRVTARSSSEGSGSSEGWLWTSMIDEALCVRASLKTSLGMHETRVQRPYGDGRYADDLVPRVEKDELEVLLRLLLDAFSQGLYEALRVVYAVLPHFRLQVLPPAQLEGGLDLGGLREPYALYPRKLLDSRKG